MTAPAWLAAGSLVARVSMLRGRPTAWSPARVARVTKTQVVLDDGDSYRLSHLRVGFLLRPDSVGATFTRLAPIDGRWSQRVRRQVVRELRRQRVERSLRAAGL